jgi:hypothetical protein
MLNKKLSAIACLITLLVLILNFQVAFAHETITVGDYEIVYGWVNEPPIAGQLNGVEIFVNHTGAGEGQPVEEHIVHTLVVELLYGGESKTLTLDPVFDTAGAFDATVLPAIPGIYSLKFSGTLGDTSVDEEVELEEVQAVASVQFPSGASANSPAQSAAGTADWLVWLTLLLGLLGVGLGAMALRKSR